LLVNLPDSSYFSGTTTDENGKFKMENIISGKYCIKITLIGYSTYISDVNVNDSVTKYDLEIIKLEIISQNLEEIVVKPENTTYKETISGTVIIPGQLDIEASNNAVDVLSKMSGIQVDEISKSISLLQGGQVLIMINGMVRNDLSYEYLRQLSPEQIIRVELITNPSVKYDAEITGVINIITDTKKNQNFIISSDFNLTLQKKQQFNDAQISLEYGFKNFRFFTTGRINYSNYYVYNITEKNIFTENSTYLDKSFLNDAQRYDYKSWLTYGFDYLINDKNVLNFTAKHDYVYRKTDNLYINKLFFNDSLSDFININSDELQKYTMSNYSLFYQKTFNEEAGHILSFDVNYYTLNDNSNKDYDYYFLTNDSLNVKDIISYNQNIKNKKYSLNFNTDYTYPITEKLILEAGYALYNTSLDNIYLDNDNFKYNEMRNSGYLNLSKEFSFIDLQAGFRLENSALIINDSAKNNITNFLPAIAILKKINTKNSIKLSFNKRLTRPTLSQLNPFITYSDPFSSFSGNPNLTPEIINKYELSYTFKNDKLFLSVTNYLYNSKDVIYNIVEQNNGIFNYNYYNVSEFLEYGIKINSRITLYEKIIFKPSINIFRESYKYQLNTNKNLSYLLYLDSYFFLPKNFIIIFRTSYFGWKLSPQGEYKNPSYNIFFIGKKLFKDEQGLIGILLWNPAFLSKYTTKSIISGANFTQTEEYGSYISCIGLKLQYNFSVGDQIKSIKRALNMDEDYKNDDTSF
jgi:outer membrane receptor for ferrienterochelin and colicin